MASERLISITRTISKACLCKQPLVLCFAHMHQFIFVEGAIRPTFHQLQTVSLFEFATINIYNFSYNLENAESNLRPSYIYISFLYPMYSESSKSSCLQQQSPTLESKRYTTHHICQYWSKSWHTKILNLRLRDCDLSYSNIIIQHHCSWVKTRWESLTYAIHLENNSQV